MPHAVACDRLRMRPLGSPGGAPVSCHRRTRATADVSWRVSPGDSELLLCSDGFRVGALVLDGLLRPRKTDFPFGGVLGGWL
jgi:hypothetical protein